MTKRRPKTDPTKSRRIEAAYYGLLASYVDRLKAAALVEAGRASPDNYDSVRRGVEYRFDELTRGLEPAVRACVKRMYGQGVKWSGVAEQRAKAGRHLGFSFDAEDYEVEYVPELTFDERRTIDLLYQRNLDLVKSIPDILKKDVLGAISDGIQRGSGMDVITRSILDRVSVARSSAERIARTETMYAVNQATLIRYNNHGVKKVVWYAALDERTCPVCGELDGKVFDMDKVPSIPAHPQCRCTIAPYNDD